MKKVVDEGRLVQLHTKHRVADHEKGLEQTLSAFDSSEWFLSLTFDPAFVHSHSEDICVSRHVRDSTLSELQRVSQSSQALCGLIWEKTLIRCMCVCRCVYVCVVTGSFCCCWLVVYCVKFYLQSNYKTSDGETSWLKATIATWALTPSHPLHFTVWSQLQP